MSPLPPTIRDPRKTELLLAQFDGLSPLAPVVALLIGLTKDTAAEAGQLVRLIEGDPVLTARVLTTLSRAEPGMRPPALTVENAVARLGFDAIRQAAIAAKVVEFLGPSDEAAAVDGSDRVEFWKHCLAVGCAARRIATKMGRSILPGEAFVFGLLHDIGKAAMQATMPKSFARVIRRCAPTRADIIDVERLVIGVDHTAVGRRLAERWGLPQRLVDCIWLHHHAPEVLPASVAAGGHVQIVQLADTLVREHGIGSSGNLHFDVSSRELAARLGLPEADRLAVIESLAEEIETHAAWPGAERMTDGGVYQSPRLRAAEELAARNAALRQQNRRLHRLAKCLAALSWLNRAVSPQAAVHEVCAVGAEALRRALSVPAVLVAVFNDAGSRKGEAPGEPGDQSRASDDPPRRTMTGLALLAARGAWEADPGEPARQELRPPDRGSLPANNRWCAIGLSDGDPRGEILEWPVDAPDPAPDVAAAVSAAVFSEASPRQGDPPRRTAEPAQQELRPPGRSLIWLLDRYRNLFNPAATLLLPLIRERRWTGGAFLAADGADASRLRQDSFALEVLGAAVALAISQAQARSSALALSDELAEANRRWSAMQPDLLRTRTLESIVDLAAGAAHELNNPLAVISGRAQMLLARTADADTRQVLETLVAQAQACSGIVTELMEFAKPPAPAPASVDLGKFIDSRKAEWAAAGLLAASELAVDVPSDTPAVHFDPEQLAGVFRELVRNAVEATDPTDRRVTIKAAADLSEENVVVEVIDNGRGMTEEVRSRALEPFFSQRPAGRGRGLGLARVHRRLRQNGAMIRIESEPGDGTRIELRLPVARRSEARSEPRP